MQDPRNDIQGVVTALVTGNADEQQSALQANFTHDAAFDHPLCVVYPSANSRDTWLSGIYTWYKVMSPGPEHKIYFHNVWWDEDKLEMVLDMSQTFHIWLSPFKPAPARLLTKLQLVKKGQLYYIKKQEDFYQPEGLTALVIPPLGLAVGIAKRIGTVGSTLSALVGQTVFGQRVPQREAAYKVS